MEPSETKEFDSKCIMLARKPAVEGADFKTAMIALFDSNNPHKTGEVAKEVLEFDNMEKIRIRDLNVSYYLEGNDIVINDLKKVRLEIYGKKIVLKGEQEEVEHRE